MVMSDKEEYEERYGEHVGYCRVHHIAVLDTCQLCEDDNTVECFQCLFVDTDDFRFTWADVDGEMRLLCWGCTDKLHKAASEAEELAQNIQLANAVNVDYLH